MEATQDRIKASELRIGNLFLASKIPSIVLEITANGIPFDSLDGNIVAGWCNWSHVFPIPLTEERLVKFGFVQVENVLTAILYNGDFGVEKDGGAWSWTFRQSHIELGRRTSSFYHHILQIQFIHQLQNLYFALTQTELPLTAPIGDK